MPEKYFSIDGFATLVTHTGPTTLPEVVPDLGRGETVLCIHGGGSNGGLFSDLLERLADAHSPLAFDLPAHGRSGGLDSLPSIERMSEFTCALSEKLGIERAVLLGHSMGGSIALQAALDRPELVRALVLLDSAAMLEVAPEVADQLRRVTEGKERRKFIRQIYAPGASPDVMRRGFMEELKTDPRAVYGDILAVRDFDVRGRLAEIRVPTLVAAGEDEMPGFGEASDLLAESIPGARRIEIAKSGHMTLIEQPDAVAEAVLAFLTELDS